MESMQYTVTPIGVVRSCFKEKFGIPRQAGLVSDTDAFVVILPPFDIPESFRGIEGFSHIWILSLLHANLAANWKPTVRPPRLGGNRRMGVFATRSPYRPNSIGLSAVKFNGLTNDSGKIYLHFSGGDLLDGTPVLDIKPYISYADAIDSADGGYAGTIPEKKYEVTFSNQAEAVCRHKEKTDSPHFRKVIHDLLSYDPRPAYQHENKGNRLFGMMIFNLDVRWRAIDGIIHVETIVETETGEISE